MGSLQLFRARPAKRVADQKQDGWSMVNEAAARSPPQPIVNMGGSQASGLQSICPNEGQTEFEKRGSEGILDITWTSDTEVAITTGANEGMLSAFMAFIEEGDEGFVFEPFFNQYISNIELAGGVVRYVPLKPPAEGAIATTSSADWTLDVDALAKALSSRTKMIVINTPRNPVGKVFSYDELSAIANLALTNNIHLLSDEVYDSLYYVPMTRTAKLSPEIWNLTLTVCSAGKPFYATGRHVGFLVGPAHLIKYVSAAHTRICYTSPSPLQEACAVGFSRASELGFWDASRKSMQSKIRRFVEVCDEMGLPYSKPEGGYFIMANFAKLVLPDGYVFPAEVEERPRDFGMLPWRKIGCDSRSVKNMMYWRMRKKG